MLFRSVLRSTGKLESTLLHEMLHLLIESRAHHDLPLWFREGLALYLADTAWDKLRNETEARQAYRTAHARVRALVDRHGRAAVMEWLVRGLPP